jgi:signal transduction histidine kinase
MNRILLLLENKANRSLLSDWLQQRYEVVFPESKDPLAVPFDLCLIDGPTLDRFASVIHSRKKAEDPAFLPVVLITSHREADLLTRHLWKTVDDLIRIPIEKLELQARVEILLRTRTLSLELKLRNEDLESFFHAMTHDLRAPLRAVKAFTQFLWKEEFAELSPQGKHDLIQIQEVTAQMQDTLDGLTDFARLEREERVMQPILLEQILQICLRHLEQTILDSQASITVKGELPAVQGNAALLTTVMTNLLSNAIKFVPPGVQPVVTVESIITQQLCRIQVGDNGIGISQEDQQKLFRPFIQLHGVEVYDGIGLGLASVRKAVEIMGGRIGLISEPGQGSTFWFELLLA